MFLSLGVILVVGFLGGLVFEKIHLPRLVFYILLGILLSPSMTGFADETLLSISSYIRQIALVIILTRSGLSLDIDTLKSIGRPAFLMCFLPATLEIVGVAVIAPMVLGISLSEALLLGSVLAAVSPAVVVPRMIKLQQERYGEKHHVAELIMAGASCDDIFVIVLFYAFKGLVATSDFNAGTLMQIPVSIVLGVLLGFVVSFVLTSFFKKNELPVVSCIILMLGSSFLMMGIENVLKPYISISSLLGIMVLGMMMLRMFPAKAKQIQTGYNGLWNCFEILLFTLVGCATDVHYALSSNGAILVGVLLIGLVCRSIGVFVCILNTQFDKKEKIFITLSYLPKATVQASIGGIALAEGLACGTLVITAAVISILITAPIGALLMDNLYKKMLVQEAS